MISALLPQSSVFSTLSCPKLPFRHQRSKDPKLISRLIPRKLLVRGPFRSPSVIKCNVSGRSGQGFRLKDVKEFHPEPFWLSLSKEAFGVLRSLIVFLIEQPSQLRYIEWPSFQSTLKTATLTLVLVALLIVAISTVDSALCYLLTLLLRRTA
ncbi:hypothetical protein MRB53_000308 [Persea americana]|uniref:Uncharacterized protein n=1 Tax=Persea americana TaxID=3435 RepID=A0ACC2MPE2_PERAE|nr:hypothetical protein MRB53_000308 [Persea americana]